MSIERTLGYVGKKRSKIFDAKVVQDEEHPVTQEVLATAITQIAESVQKLYRSGLNRRAVIALVADDTKLGKGTIRAVLDSLLDLSKTYTK